MTARKASLALALGAASSIAAAATPQEVGGAVWRVTDEQATTLGSAFAIDKRGYLLTAGHVVRNRSTVFVSLDDTRKEARVLFNSCSGFDGSGLCATGDDAALLGIQDLPPPEVGDFSVLDIDLKPRLEGASVDAKAWGLTGGKQPSVVPVPVPGTFVLETAQRRHWRTQANIQRGMSGGPVALERSALAILSWRLEITADAPATGAFATPVDLVHERLAAQVPASDDVVQLVQRVRDGIKDGAFRTRLHALDTLGLIHLVRNLFAEDGQVRLKTTIAQLLRDRLYQAGLHRELGQVANVLASRGNLAAARDSGTALLWASWQAPASEAPALARRAAIALEAFVDQVVEVGPTWAGPRVIAATSGDIGNAYARAGDEAKAAEWFAVGHLVGQTPASTQYLAEFMARKSEFDSSRALSCEAFFRGRHTPAMAKTFRDLQLRAASASPESLAAACRIPGHSQPLVTSLLTARTKRVLSSIGRSE